MKKIVIMPYFGKFPVCFDLWLHSCELNASIDFLVVTDQTAPREVSANVRWVNISFEELRQQFQKKLGFRIWLKNPYKLCDYKGFYGFLFSEYLQGYDFWGYCDCDVIFGNIQDFLPEELFERYDKLLRTGHLSFIRNSPQINENFRNYDTYKRVLTSPVIYGYDEAVDGYRKGFAGELMEQGFRFYQNDQLPADIDFRHYPLRVVTAPQACCVFSYSDGTLEKIYREDGTLRREPCIYVHLQKRKMDVEPGVQKERFLIGPDRFLGWKPELLVDEEFWKDASTERDGYFNFRKERNKERMRDVRRLFYEPKKLACLRYRFQNKG